MPDSIAPDLPMVENQGPTINLGPDQFRFDPVEAANQSAGIAPKDGYVRNTNFADLKERSSLRAALPDRTNNGGMTPNVITNSKTDDNPQDFRDLGMNIKALSLLTGDDQSDVSGNYEQAKQSFVKQQGWDMPKTEAEFRGQLTDYFQKEDAREEALSMIPQMAVQASLEDAQKGATSPMASRYAEWNTQAGGAFLGLPEAEKMALFMRYYAPARKELNSDLAPLAAQIATNYVNDPNKPFFNPQENPLPWDKEASGDQGPGEIKQQTTGIPDEVFHDRLASLDAGQIKKLRQLVRVYSGLLQKKGPSDSLDRVGSHFTRTFENAAGNIHSAIEQVAIKGAHYLTGLDKTRASDAGKAETDDLRRLRMKSLLRTIRQNDVNPNTGHGALEDFAGEVAGVGSYVASFAMGAGLGNAFMVSSGMGDYSDKHIAENPDVSEEELKAATLSVGAITAGINAFGMGIVSRSFPEMEARMATLVLDRPILNNILHSGIGAGVMTASSLAETAGDAVFQGALKDFAPDQDFAAELKQTILHTPSAFFAMLIAGGAAHGKFSDDDRAAYIAQLKDPISLKISGINPDALAGKSDDQVPAAFRAAWANRDKDAGEAYREQLQQMSQDASRDITFPKYSVDTKTGEHTIHVFDPINGNIHELLRTSDVEAAGKAYDAALAMWRHDLLACFQLERMQRDADAKAGITGRSYQYSLSGWSGESNDRSGLSSLPEELKNRIIAAELPEGSPLVDVIVRGWNTTHPISADLAHDALSYVSNLHNADLTPDTQVHERADDWTNRVLSSGQVSADQFVRWLKQAEEAVSSRAGKKVTFLNNKTDPDTNDIVEAVTKAGVHLFAGHTLDYASYPPELRGFYMAMGAYFTEAQKLGEHIKGAVDSGEIDEGFRNHLMTALGLPMAERLAPAEAKAKAELMEEKVGEPGKAKMEGAETRFSLKGRNEEHDLSKVMVGSDLAKSWKDFPSSSTEINRIPDNLSREELKSMASNLLSNQPRTVKSPWGEEVVIHKIKDIQGKSEHFSSGTDRYNPTPERVELIGMLQHTIQNAMAYGSAGGKGRGAYIYKYADGTTHVVIVQKAGRSEKVERQFVVTQFDHDQSKNSSAIKIFRKNDAARKLPSGPEPSLSQGVAPQSQATTQTRAEGDGGVNPRFSIRTKEDRDRVSEEFERQIQSSPEAYVPIWKAMRERIQKVQETVDRFASMDSREANKDFPTIQREQALVEISALINSLPKDIRAEFIRNWRHPYTGEMGNIFSKYSSLKDDAARADFLIKTTQKAREALDDAMVHDFSTRHENLLDASEPKARAGERPQGKLGADTHALLNRIREYSQMDLAEVSSRDQQLEADKARLENGDMEDPDRDAKIAEIEKQIYLLSLHGGMSITNAEGKLKTRELRRNDVQRMGEAVENLKQIIQDGRFEFNEQKKERMDRIKAMRQDAVNLTNAGRPGSPSKMTKAQQQENKITNSLTTWFNNAQLPIPYFRTIFKNGNLASEWARRLYQAANSEMDRNIKWRHDSMEALRMAWGKGDKPTSILSVLKTIADLSKPVNTGIKVRSNMTFTSRTIGRDELPQFKGLTTDREYNYLMRVLSQNDKIKTLTIHELTDPGDEEELHLSPLQLVDALWAADQPDAQEKVQRNGLTPEVVAQIRAFLGKTKALDIYDLGKQAFNRYDEINAVFRKLYGVDLPKVDNYAPLSFDTSNPDKIIDMEEGQGGGAGSTPSWSKSRGNVGGALRYDNAWMKLQNHMETVNYWLSHAETLRDFRAVFGDTKVLRAVGSSDSNARTFLQNFMKILARDAQTSGNVNNLTNWLNKVYGSAMAVATLGGSIPTAIKHVTVATAPLLEMPLHQFIPSALRVMTGTAQRGAWFGSDAMVKDPLVSRFGNITHSESGRDAVQASKDWNGVFSTASLFGQEAGKLSMQGIHKTVNASAAWSAAVRYDGAFREGKAIGLDDSAAKDYAEEKVNDMLHETLNPTAPIDRPISRWGKVGPDWLQMYAGPAAQRLAKVIDIYRRGDLKPSDKASRIAVGGWIAAGVLEWITKAAFTMIAGTDHQKEDVLDWRDLAASVAAGPVYGLPSFAGPILSTGIKSVVKGHNEFYASGNPYSDLAGSIRRIAKHYESGKLDGRDAAEAFKDGGLSLALLAGFLHNASLSKALAGVAAWGNTGKAVAGTVENVEE